MFNSYDTPPSQPKASSSSSSATVSGRRRKTGLCLLINPYCSSFNSVDKNACYPPSPSSFFSQAPTSDGHLTQRATFSGTPSIKEPVFSCARRACEFKTFIGETSGNNNNISRDSSFITLTNGSQTNLSGGDLYLDPYFLPINQHKQVQESASFRSSKSLFIGLSQIKPPRLATQLSSPPKLTFNDQDMSDHESMTKSTITTTGSNEVAAGFHTISLNNNDYGKATRPATSVIIGSHNSSAADHSKLSVLDASKLNPFASMKGADKGPDTNSDCSSTARSRRAQKHQNLKPPFPMAGLLGALGASILFATAILWLKLIPDSNSLEERTKQMFWRGAFMMLFTGPTIIYQGSTFKVKRDEILITFLRSVFGIFALYASYISWNYISIGESQAIVFSAPIWTSILGYFILGEKFSWSILIGLPVSFIGLILIAHPDLIVDVNDQLVKEIEYHHHESHYAMNHTLRQHMENFTSGPVNETLMHSSGYTFGNLSDLVDNGSNLSYMEEADSDIFKITDLFYGTRLPGIVIASFSSFMAAGVYIVLKFRKSTPVQTTTFYLGLFSCVFTLLLSTFIGTGRWPTTLFEWSLLAGNGLFSWLAQTLIQWAITYENASIISVMRSFDVVLAFIYSALFLDDDVLWTSVLGAALILVVVVLIMLNNSLMNICRKNSL